jgi:fructan beta-fructosidase
MHRIRVTELAIIAGTRCRQWMTLAALASACLAMASAPGVTREYNEQYRPQYHFSPPGHWMNDPNGLVFLDGEYHLFYQYNPYGTQWGPMHWGHAISRDMVHWQNLPIALYPDEHGTIFSGSAVNDGNNTSELGTRDHPPLVAIYTNHDATIEKAGAIDFQNQSIAYSLDKGRTWTKDPDNPVLANPGIRDFRDPNVSWFEPTKSWIMTLAVADHVGFYSSKDLKRWVHESDFGREWGTHQGVWECPDLIAMTVEGEASRKYVLLVSVNSGGPNGGSATQYFIGDFDGHRYSLDPDLRPRLQVTPAAGTAASALWIDYGTDDYAGVTWSGIPDTDGRRLFLGWMSNWIYAQKVPSVQWRSAMTVPRELKLVRSTRGLELHSTPVAELAGLRASGKRIDRQAVRSDVDLTRSGRNSSGLLELDLKIDTASADLITMEFANSEHQKTVFRINKKLRRYELDRSKSGAIDFDPRFAAEQFAPMLNTAPVISLALFLDRSSLEIFINEGETVMTVIEFPSAPYNKVTLKTDQPIRLDSGAVYTLNSSWNLQ